eukprot:766797-Hanusia_phi.AAC.7
MANPERGGGQVLFSNNPLLRVIDGDERIGLAGKPGTQTNRSPSELNECKCDYDRLQQPSIFTCPSLSCPQPPSPGPRCTTMARTDCESSICSNRSEGAVTISSPIESLERDPGEQTDVFNKDEANQRLQRTLHRISLLRQKGASAITPQKSAHLGRSTREIPSNETSVAKHDREVGKMANPFEVQAELSDFIYNLPVNIISRSISQALEAKSPQLESSGMASISVERLDVAHRALQDRQDQQIIL